MRRINRCRCLAGYGTGLYVRRSHISTTRAASFYIMDGQQWCRESSRRRGFYVKPFITIVRFCLCFDARIPGDGLYRDASRNLSGATGDSDQFPREQQSIPRGRQCGHPIRVNRPERHHPGRTLGGWDCRPCGRAPTAADLSRRHPDVAGSGRRTHDFRPRD